MSTHTSPPTFVAVLTAVCAAAFLVFVGLLGLEWRRVHHTTVEAKAAARARVLEATAKLDAELKRVVPVTDAIARDLESGALPKKDLANRLQNDPSAAGGAFGLGSGFAPYAFDPARRLYGPYSARRGDHRELIQIEDLYDYTVSEPNRDWYGKTVENGPGWHEPFFGKASQTVVAPYCVPFTLPEPNAPRPSGVICGNFSVDDVRLLVDSLNLGKTGYAFIVSRAGRILAHPDRDYARRGVTVAQMAEGRRDPIMGALSERILHAEQGEIDAHDPRTGERTWIFHQPISTTGWTLAVVVLRDEMLAEGQDVQHRQMWLVVAGVGFFASAILLFLSRRQQTDACLWLGSAMLSLLFFVGMGALWHIELARGVRSEHVLLVDEAGVANFLEARAARARESHLEPPTKIPTGMFVQAIAFVGAHSFVVSGYVWQKYDLNVHAKLERGFVLPDWVPEQDVLEEAYRRTEGDTEIVGWFFKATFREPFDYTKFPVDSHELKVRLWPKSRDSNVILVPDLDSYRYVNPRSLPGMERGFALPGWRVDRTYFAYSTYEYGTDFGLKGSVASEGHPELSFNVAIQRNLVDAIISNVIPLIVAAVMLFAMLIIDTRDRFKAERFGFNTSTVLATCAALFFVVLLAHVQIRSQISSQQIMYLEYFYFATYFSVVAVSLNAFLLASGWTNYVIIHRDNLIPKLMFWPCFWGMLFVITVFTMY